jgi:hypothetical protein
MSFVPLLQTLACVGLIPELFFNIFLYFGGDFLNCFRTELLKGILNLRLCHGSNEKGTDHLPSSDESITSFS